MGLFDNLLNEVSEADREVFRKYPQVAQKIDQADEFVGKWEQWKADNWDSGSGMTKNAISILAEKDNEIEALRLLQGNDMTWDEMKGNVEGLLKTQKVMTTETFERDFMPKMKFAKPEDIETVRTDLANLSRGMDVAYAHSAHLPMKYFKEFGAEAPDFTMVDLFKYMGDNKINNFDQAYDAFVSPLRTKKQEAVAKEREETIRAEARAEAQKEFTLAHGALPVDNLGSSPEMSPLKMRINARNKVETDSPKLTPGELGSGAAAQDAYSQFMRDAAAGVKPKLPSYMNVQ